MPADANISGAPRRGELQGRGTAWWTKAGFLLIILGIMIGCEGVPGPNSPADHLKRESAAVAEQLLEYEAMHRFDFVGRHSVLSGLEWNPGAVPFVWLHGTYSSAYEFAVIAERLSRRGYHVLSVEYAGHGQAPLHHGPLSIQELADDVVSLIRTRCGASAIIGGASRGASVAATIFERAPEVTQSLVLLDGGSWSLQEFAASLGEEEIAKWLSSFHDMATGLPRFPKFDSAGALLSHGRKFRDDEGLSERERLLRDFSAIARSEIDDSGKLTWLRPSLLAYFGQDNYSSTLRGFMNPAEAPLLLGSTSLQNPLQVFRNLDRPVLIIDPSADFLDFSQQNLRLREAHPEHVHLVTYSDIGHDVMSGAILRFYRDLTNFLKYGVKYGVSHSSLVSPRDQPLGERGRGN